MPPVYEALLLNTVVPQIQAAQAGDSYVMVVNATTPALRITQTGTGNALEVEDSSNPDATPFVVSAAGDVGIGTSSPNAKLHILAADATTADLARFQQTNQGNLLIQSQQGGLNLGSANGILFSNATGNMGWRTNASSGNANMLLDQSGNLGIGTSSPASKLTVSRGGSAGLVSNFTDGLAQGLALTTGTGYFGFYNPNFGAITFRDGGNAFDLLRLDASGNLGLGVTPTGKAKFEVYTGVGAYAGISTRFNATNLPISFGITNANGVPYLGVNARQVPGTDGQTYDINGFASRMWCNGGGFAFFTAPSGTAGNAISFTQAMTLNASGNLGVGETNPSSEIEIARGSGGAAGISLRANGNSTSTEVYVAQGAANQFFLYNRANEAIYFGTNNTERARITSGGYFKASNSGTYVSSTGTYHEMRSSTANDVTTYFSHTDASNPFGIYIAYANAAPNGTGNAFLTCQDSTPAVRAEIRSNGGLANYSANNVNLASDERLKKDISPLGSTWSKVKAIEVVNFRYKDCNEGDPALFGVIAQQVQPIVPELVVVTQQAKDAVEAKDAVLDADGNVVEPAVAAKEATPEYYGIREQPMYWLAIKALQEAMARIETLEAEVAALKGA